MNPCRCGYLADPAKACSRAPQCGRNYVAKLSGPLLDRFDLIIDMAALPPLHLLDDMPAPASATIAERIAQAAAYRLSRPPADKPEFADNVRPFLETIVQEMEITGRGYDKIVKVARTIADLEASPQIKKAHLQEAMAYRKIRLVL